MMEGIIRKALVSDVMAIVELAEQKRLVYQEYQPLFWRKAANSRELHTSFIKRQIDDDRIIVLVHERDGVIDGFLIATLVPSPPVYHTEGLTGSIDDFWVTEGNDWAGIGKTLLDTAIQAMKKRGAVQVVVVCGHLDQAKRSMLQTSGYTIASEWYVKGI